MLPPARLEIIQIEIELQIGDDCIALYVLGIKKDTLLVEWADYVDIASRYELFQVKMLPYP